MEVFLGWEGGRGCLECGCDLRGGRGMGLVGDVFLCLGLFLC